MIDISTASKLLDFGARIGPGQRADEQLEGAVAVHNLLESKGVAYLADEVGMGKTYVALGVLALFRHFQPDFRVLFIAPRSNIQAKWIKELKNFVSHNVRFPDLRMKSLDDRPARPLVKCENIVNLVHEVMIDRDRDFFTRLTSFSLPILGRDAVDRTAGTRLRDELRRHLPWMRDEIFDLRNKQTFKDNFARALCCALPQFDLIIVDEAHNLKHGFSEHVSSRNRVLGLAMGHANSATDKKLFPGFGPRAQRVLFLSATPVEDTYHQLWNQLDIFGLAEPYRDLLRQDLEEHHKKTLASQFLIRRVTSIRIGENEYTKNQYRREWRRGGVHQYDEPIQVDDVRQRLVVALVQKKVSELLGHERFSSSFQIGMLASFESFLETAKLKRDEIDLATFDDPDQTNEARDELEKEGIDVADVNRLARSYRQKFGTEMPHPKMDALVKSLSTSWTTGKKALVFVRRVASVKELKRKLDECYDAWLMSRLARELPSLDSRLQLLFQQYRDEKAEAESKQHNVVGGNNGRPADDTDHGGIDTFFAWFFRGEGPRGVVSGANIQQRFVQSGTAYATFFAENYVADILGCRPGEVQSRLAAALNVTEVSLRATLQDGSSRFLSRAKKPARADRFDSVQAAAIELLKDVPGPYQELARIVWHERFENQIHAPHASQAPDIGDLLELSTFFTEIRLRPELRAALWPVCRDPVHLRAFRERELRAQLLASAARLGHSLIDLYIMTISRLGSLELRSQESGDEEGTSRDKSRIEEYLDLLERQMRTPTTSRDWGAFDELSDLAENFELILDVNEPEVRHKPLAEVGARFGKLLGQQQPNGGMSGQVNQTLVRQFRMPGYPLVLVSTDLLQEGEDLHTFCSAVHHYGISWTPSSMEQRVGRIDRVRSHSDRRLSRPNEGALAGEDKLQVYFPHLEDTVEVLQVHRVLERMNVFLRLMHEGLTIPGTEQRTINANHEFAKTRRLVLPIVERLESAFPIRPEHLEGRNKGLARSPELAAEIGNRLARLVKVKLPDVDVTWEPQTSPGQLTGTAHLTTHIKPRVQPFTLILGSMGSHPVVRCVSPVGRVGLSEDPAAVVASTLRALTKIGAILTKDDRTYDLTVESEVILSASPEFDALRVSSLIRRVVSQADLLEQELLPGNDAGLDTFRKDLELEADDGR